MDICQTCLTPRFPLFPLTFLLPRIPHWENAQFNHLGVSSNLLILSISNEIWSYLVFARLPSFHLYCTCEFTDFTTYVPPSNGKEPEMKLTMEFPEVFWRHGRERFLVEVWFMCISVYYPTWLPQILHLVCVIYLDLADCYPGMHSHRWRQA